MALNIKFKQNGGGSGTGGSGDQYYVMLGLNVMGSNMKGQDIDYSAVNYHIPDNIEQFVVTLQIDMTNMAFNLSDIRPRTDEVLNIGTIEASSNNLKVAIYSLDPTTYDTRYLAIKLEDYIECSHDKNTFYIDSITIPKKNDSEEQILAPVASCPNGNTNSLLPNASMSFVNPYGNIETSGFISKPAFDMIGIVQVTNE